MRRPALCLVLAALCAAAAHADAPRITIGDIPRTYNHYLNADEAAMCRANVSAGGIGAYFFNPASAAEITGVAGQATIRWNNKSRDYLPSGADDNLKGSDDGFHFTQAVAAKLSANWVLGFGYSAPSYRNYKITGQRVPEGGGEAENYRAEFAGAVRYFEIIAATRIGTDGKGGIGIAAGLVTLNEASDEDLGDDSLGSSSLKGSAASVAFGFVFDATETVTIGLGYRMGSHIQVKGDAYTNDNATGTSETQSTAVGGVRFRPTPQYAVYVSYIHEGWDGAKATISSYPEPDEPGEDPTTGAPRNEFDKNLGTVALGGEGTFYDGRFTARAGYAAQLESGIEGALVPEYSIGLGGSLNFEQYLFELSLVREQYALDGEGAQALNYGIYFTIGYVF